MLMALRALGSVALVTLGAVAFGTFGTLAFRRATAAWWNNNTRRDSLLQFFQFKIQVPHDFTSFL